VFECIVKQSYCVVQIERLSGIDDKGRYVKVCGDSRQLSVGQFADECGVGVQLNANGSVKYTERYK